MNIESSPEYEANSNSPESVVGQHAVLIMNPTAGRGLVKSREPETLDALKKAGIEYTLQHSEDRGHATELARQAVVDGAKLIIAGGGDGTVHEIAAGMWDSDAVLGVIPLGSGNDFAGSQGIPMDVEGAVRLIGDGVVRYSDVGRFGEWAFFNTMGVGFGPTVTVNARRHRYLRGLPLYMITVIQSLFGYKSINVALEAPGYSREKLTFMLVVGIGTREGGGFRMTPDAVLDDGLFDLCFVDDIGLLTRFKVLPIVTKGEHTDLSVVEMLKVPSLKIRTEAPIVLHADGEIYETGMELELNCLKQALKVISKSL
jgi:YegS/Rv2252/BmrU family lipid kinase